VGPRWKVQDLAVVAAHGGVRRHVAKPHDRAQRLLSGGVAVGVAGCQAGVVHQHGLRSHQDGVDPVPDAVVVRQRLRAGDPLAGAVLGRDPAVQGLGDVQGDEGALGVDGLEPAPVQLQRTLGGQSAAHADPRRPQGGGPAGGGIMGVVDGVHDVRYPGVDDGLGARSRAAHVVARLQGDHHGGPVKVDAGADRRRYRIGFCVRGAGTAVVSRRQLAAVRPDDDGAHQRIGPPGALQGGFQGRVHGGCFSGGEGRYRLLGSSHLDTAGSGKAVSTLTVEGSAWACVRDARHQTMKPARVKKP
jgi:hypothetical protein